MSSSQDQNSEIDQTTASGLLDYFTSVDNKLDEVGEQITTLVQAVGKVNQNIAALVDLQGGDSVSLREFPFSLAAEVPANTPRLDPLSNSFEAPFDCTITEVYLGFPAGVQQSVGVQLSDGVGEIWVPRGGTSSTVSNGERDPEFLTEADQTITVSLNVDVDEGEPIVASFISNDPENNHFITVTPVLRERVGGD